MSKAVQYPTWRYKSKLTYAKQKKKEWDAMVKLSYKVHSGSAWLPPKIKKALDAIFWADEGRVMDKFVKRIKKDSPNL